jgi:hypothetical protein
MTTTMIKSYSQTIDDTSRPSRTTKRDTLALRPLTLTPKSRQYGIGSAFKTPESSTAHMNRRDINFLNSLHG